MDQERSKQRKAKMILAGVVVLVIIPALLALLAVEIYVRVSREYVTPATLHEQSLQYEGVVFARHALKRRAQDVNSIAGRSYRINQHGYRGADFSFEKPGGVTRVVVYGGSAAFDTSVDLGKDWTHRAGDLLHQRGLTQYEMINAATPGHASFDSLGRLLSEGHRMQPDVVVLYHGWNDLKWMTKTEPLLRQVKPFVEGRDPRMTYQNGLDELLSNVSQLYVRLRQRYYTAKLHAGFEGSADQDGSDYTGLTVEGRKQFRLILQQFVSLVRSIGAMPVLTLQGRLVRTDNTPEERETIRYEYIQMQHDALVQAYQDYDDDIRAVAEEMQVHLVDLSEGITGNAAYFGDHVHLSDAGSQAIARKLADALESISHSSVK